MTSTRSSDLLRFFLFAYVISVGFTDVLNLPLVGSKIQVPEIIFIPLLFTWIIHNFKDASIRNLLPGKLELSILLYILVAALSTIFNESTKSWLEVIGLIYLFGVYIVFKTSLKLIPDPAKFIRTAFISCGIVAALSAKFGWTLASNGIETILAMPDDVNYPYLGHLARATGFMDSPNMLFNLLAVCMLIYFPYFLGLSHKKITDYLILYILAIGAILTFSKSILLLIIALMYIFYKRKTIRKPFLQFSMTAIASFLFIIWITGTHILVRKSSETDWSQGREKGYTLSTPFAETGSFQLFKTNYLVNKESAIQAGKRNSILGVGPGNFNQFVGRLKEEGLYPEYFINFDPHSTYLGAFAEMGLIGLLGMMFLCYQIFLSLQRTKTGIINRSFLISVNACFLFLALEAISMDILNFRHVWILIGVLSLSLHLPQNKPEPTSH